MSEKKTRLIAPNSQITLPRPIARNNEGTIEGLNCDYIHNWIYMTHSTEPEFLMAMIRGTLQIGLAKDPGLS